ncbi:MAG: U-box domain-containing protein [Promethearchaeia archaeon]
MDRTTILRHLKTNSTDPYTNTELRATSLMPASELLPKYKAWLARCRAACN